MATRLEHVLRAGALLRQGSVVVLDDSVVVTGRKALGVVLLACGAGCSEQLISEHVAAAIAMGNRVVLTFVEAPTGDIAALVAVLQRCISRAWFQVVASPGEAWHIRPEDALSVAVLTPSSLTVDDHRLQHVLDPDMEPDLHAMFRRFSASTAVTVPVTVTRWRP